MFETILVPTDGSDCAALALDHVVDIARHYDATVHLLHVLDVRDLEKAPDVEPLEDDAATLVDETESGSGNLDAGFGLHIDDEESVEWLTAVGFATESEEKAIAHARDALDAGYESEREAFERAWRDWHDGVGGKQTGDAIVDDLYERSLTSLKCAEDHCEAMIAGAFKPTDMTYKFIWPRDQVIIVQALAAGGALDEARQALEWLDRVQITDADDETSDDRGIDRRGTWWQNYYTTGEPHWRALQLDQVGGPIYAHWLLWRETGDDDLLEEHYEMSARAAEFLLGGDNGYGFPRKHQDPWEEVWGHSTEGSASAIAGLRCMAEMAVEAGDEEFAAHPSGRAAANEFCSPRCESAGKGLSG